MKDETKLKLKKQYRDELLTNIEYAQKTIQLFEQGRVRAGDEGVIRGIDNLIEFEQRDIQACRNKLAYLRKGGKWWD